MKIGFSLGRCIRDVVNGDVKLNDVAFIIASTCIRDVDHLVPVIEDYSYRSNYLSGLDQPECQRVALELWNTNRILQPADKVYIDTCSLKALFGLIYFLQS